MRNGFTGGRNDFSARFLVPPPQGNVKCVYLGFVLFGQLGEARDSSNAMVAFTSHNNQQYALLSEIPLCGNHDSILAERKIRYLLVLFSRDQFFFFFLRFISWQGQKKVDYVLLAPHVLRVHSFQRLEQHWRYKLNLCELYSAPPRISPAIIPVSLFVDSARDRPPLSGSILHLHFGNPPP